MADPAIAAPPKKKLPFKRTIARRKTPDPTVNGAEKAKKEDDDDGVDLFRRVDDELPQVLEEQKRRVTQKENRSSSSAAIKRDHDNQNVKRRKLSIDLDSEGDDDEVTRGSVSNIGSAPGSASKLKVPASALFDDDDIFMDVKGKGKETFRHTGALKTRKTQPSSPANKVISLDYDDDEDVEVAPSPQPPRSGSYGGRRTRSRRIASPQHDDAVLSNPFAEPLPAVKTPPDDDDDDDDLQIVDGPPELDDEPDEFEEYVKRARERAEERERLAKLKLERESQAKDSQETESAGQGSFGAGDDSKIHSRESAMDDVIVKILVTSEIPHSRQKLFDRRFHAPLGPVRDVWAASQKPPVPKEKWPLIFLTWKGNRIYATTTCANLGIRVESVDDGTENKGKLGSVAGAEYANLKHGGGLHEGGLHLEAWTEELYQDYLKRKERERLRLLGQLDDEDDDDGTPGTGARGSEDPDGGAGGDEEATTRVILKAAKDYEPLRFKVHAQTTIDEMITTFRISRKVPEDSEISLFFDGEKLDRDLAVKDTEIEDMDSLEVHIK